MKVLWFSNAILSKNESIGSGSWLHAMRDLIASDIELVNITEGSVDSIASNRGNGIKEYILPQWKKLNGVPNKENIQKIAYIISQEKPDVVHVWGVEKYWALLFSRGLINHNRVLLEMQGVASGVLDVYYGGLTPLQCKQIKSFKSFFIRKQRLAHLYKEVKKSADYEEEIITHFDSIATQSDWTRDQLISICREGTHFYHSLRPIRNAFFNADKWGKKNHDSPIIFASFSYYSPFKGAHILLSALSLLKKQYPNIQLRLAGPKFYGLPFYKGMDYGKYLSRLIDDLKIAKNIHFCGNLNASQLVQEILQADAIVNPSFVESYSAAAAEALFLGAPTILAYAGAMVNFSKEKPVALYYNPMDYRSLAARIHTVFSNDDIRAVITKNAVSVLSRKCNPTEVRETQLSIYREIASSMK